MILRVIDRCLFVHASDDVTVVGMEGSLPFHPEMSMESIFDPDVRHLFLEKGA